jgi:molybdopterin converting factor small subunit
MTEPRTLTVRLFAGARESLHTDSVSIDLQTPMDVQSLKRELELKYSALIPFLKHGRIAVDNEFVDENYTIDNISIASTIALIPPVSGG